MNKEINNKETKNERVVQTVETMHTMQPGDKLLETFSPKGLKAHFKINDQSQETIAYPLLFFAHIEHRNYSRLVGMVARNGVEIVEDMPGFLYYSEMESSSYYNQGSLFKKLKETMEESKKVA